MPDEGQTTSTGTCPNCGRRMILEVDPSDGSIHFPWHRSLCGEEICEGSYRGATVVESLKASKKY